MSQPFSQLKQHKERVTDKIQGLVKTILGIPALIHNESGKQVHTCCTPSAQVESFSTPASYQSLHALTI
jgi:hypothetical protein